MPNDKDSCPQCGQTHEEEMENRQKVLEIITSGFTDEVFLDFWEDWKDDLKSLSKKEMAEEVFFQAIAGFLDNTLPDKPEEFMQELHRKQKK